MVTFSKFVKSATALYDYSGAHSRDYVPAKPSVSPKVVSTQKETSYQPEIKSKKNPDSPENGENKEVDPNVYPTWRYIHPFSPTVSGTGHGRQYWPDMINPYDS